MTTTELTIREALREALRTELEQDPDVFLMGEDVGEAGGVYKVTGDLYEEFGGDRVRDTPISEAGIVGGGVGAAMQGGRPVVEVMYSDFLGICLEQLHNQAAKLRYMSGDQVDMPLTIRTAEGGGAGVAAQHSGTMHVLPAHLPGLKVAAPATPAASKGLLKTAIRSDDPVVFFENKMTYNRSGPVPTDDDFTLPLGEAGVERDGEDVTVVATQRLLFEALDLAEDLAGDVDCEVIDPRSLYPLDTETIAESVRKTGRLIVADESTMSYGLHAEIMARTVEQNFFDLDAPVQRVGTPDTPVPFSPYMENEVLPKGPDIEAAIDKVV